jgi:tetratricopeptide (TPR) repeat protein
LRNNSIVKFTITTLLLVTFLFSSIVLADDWSKGQELLEAGLYQEALSAFNLAWSKDPQKSNGNFYMNICKKLIKARQLFEDSKYLESLNLTEEAATFMPGNEHIKFLVTQRRKAVNLKNRINDNYEEGKHEEILIDYQKLLDLNPKDGRTARAVEAYRQFAMQLDNAKKYFRQGEWEESMMIYKKAWTLLPTDKYVQDQVSLNMQALAALEYYRDGNYKEAEYKFKQLFQQNTRIDIFRQYLTKSKKAAILSMEARVSYAELNFLKAINYAQLLLEINPDDVRVDNIYRDANRIIALLTEGDDLLLQQQDYNEAYRLFKSGVREFPELKVFEDRVLVAELIRKGQLKEDEEFTFESLDRFKNYKSLRWYVLNRQEAQQDVAEETEIVQKILNLRNEGIKLFYSRNYLGSIEKMNEVLRINAKDDTALRFRSISGQAMGYIEEIKQLYYEGNDEEAKYVYKRLLELNPDTGSLEQVVAE